MKKLGVLLLGLIVAILYSERVRKVFGTIWLIISIVILYIIVQVLETMIQQ